MTRVGRRAPAAAAVAVVLLYVALVAGAAPAAAHNRRTAFSGTYGPYDVVAATAYVHEGGDPGVVLDLFLRAGRPKRPVEEARVTITARAGATVVGPVVAERLGDAHRVVLPDDPVASFVATIEVRGPAGSVVIDEEVPGAGVLRPDAGGHLDGADAAVPWTWVGAVVAVALAVGASSFTGRWRPVLATSAVGLVAAAGAALVGSWSSAAGSTPVKVLAAVPPVAAAGLLAAGVGLLRRRRDDALFLVFAGAAGLGTLFGWTNRSFLVEGDLPTALPEALARVTVALALGLGGGLVLLVTGLHRDTLRHLLPGRRPVRAPGAEVD